MGLCRGTHNLREKASGIVCSRLGGHLLYKKNKRRAPIRDRPTFGWCPSRLNIQEIKKSGDTYSRAFGTTIGFESLTTVFGMGTGVAFRKRSPERSAATGEDRRTYRFTVNSRQFTVFEL
jgi:hypothetical protein